MPFAWVVVNTEMMISSILLVVKRLHILDCNSGGTLLCHQVKIFCSLDERFLSGVPASEGGGRG